MVYGFLRETTEKAKQAGLDKETKLPRTGLDEYLKVIFPKTNDWVHDKTIPNTKRKCRPDYRSESLKLIVEFDGLPHYQSPDMILADKEHTKFYEELGYKVVRIPFFIQLTNDMVKKLFDIELDITLFPEGIHSFSIKDRATPAYMCYDGMKRAAKELRLIANQDQLNTNMNYLAEQKNDSLSGFKMFSKIVTKYLNYDLEFKEFRVIHIKNYIQADGGKSNYPKLKTTNDCVIRAICNVTGKDYKDVYDDLSMLNKLCSKRPLRSKVNDKATTILDLKEDGIIAYLSDFYLRWILGYKFVKAIDRKGYNFLDIYDDGEIFEPIFKIPHKKALVVCENHMFALKDGNMYDNFKSYPDEKINNKELNNRFDHLELIKGYWIPCKHQYELYSGYTEMDNNFAPEYLEDDLFD